MWSPGLFGHRPFADYPFSARYSFTDGGGGTAMLSSRVGRRWIFRADPGWLGGHRHEDMLALVVCGALVLGGIPMAMSGLWDGYRVMRSYFWPTTTGYVVSVKMEEIGSLPVSRWQPRVTYSYSVNGRTFVSMQLSVSGPLEIGSESDARSYLHRYIPNTPVTVYYDPVRPAESALEQSLSERTSRSLTFGLGACLVGVALLLLFDFLRR
jgi:hypothetical protein